MNKFKKMRLIPYEDPNIKTEIDTNNIKSYVNFETPSSVKQMNDLDNEMEAILKSNLDVDTKSKLYSNALRKFLNTKQKFIQSDSKNKTPICVDISSSDQSTSINEKSQKSKRTNKKVKKSNKSIIKSSESNKKSNQNKKKNKKKPSKINNFLKPSILKQFIEKIVSENGPTWTEY